MSGTTAIINYDAGNLFSLVKSFETIGESATVTLDPDVIRNADRIVLPGVGAFGASVRRLTESGLCDVIKEEARNGKRLLGICLGMQLLFEGSSEFGNYEGLGLLKGKIAPISDIIPKDYKIPHIGWNALRVIRGDSRIISPDSDGKLVYFVHSFSARDCGDDVVATTEYGAEITAAVEHENIFGCQFHPEKSGEVGLEILRAFCLEGQA